MTAPEPSRRRRIFAVSAALHVLVLGGIALLPRAQRLLTESTTYAPIELVPWAEPAAAAPADHGGGREPEALAPAPRSPEASTKPSVTTPRRDRPRGSTPSADAPTTQPSDEPTPDPPPNPRALALTGLREHSQGGVALPRPRVTSETRDEDDDVGASPIGVLREAGFSRGRDGKLTMRSAEGGFTATLSPDGRVHFDDAPVNPFSPPDGYSVIAGLQGKEVHARAKAQLLAKTFDARLAIAVGFAKRNVDRQLAALPSALLDVWAERGRTALQRRRTLFERWDECEETITVELPGFEKVDDKRIDALRRDAGEQARAQIIEFIRRHVPQDGPDAYGPEEIAELDGRRRSRQHFAPYE